MSTRRPPSVATWLLNRLEPSERNESLEGDLFEEYQRRQSRIWYWKQALTAIAIIAGRDIRAHKLLVVRAVVVGSIALSFFSSLLSLLTLKVIAKEVPASWWTHHGNYPRGVEIVAGTLMCVAAFGSGWVVARLHRSHRVAMLLAYFASFLLYGLAFMAAVPPSHSRYAWAMVFALYGACILWGGLWITFRKSASSSHIGGLTA